VTVQPGRIVAQPDGRASSHLACLRWCEIAESERVGQRMLYRLTDASVVELIDRDMPLVEDR